jgi:Tfp pilus assembly protein PilE
MFSKTVSKLRQSHSSEQGLTVIELVFILVIIGVLLTIIFSAYAGVHRNQNNQNRESAVSTIYKNLEAYYVDNSNYPTLSEMNSATWVAKNMPTLSPNELKDPAAKTDKLVSGPRANAYAYEVTAADGGSCDNVARLCQHYSLIATLDNSSSKTYVKSSLN